MRLAHRKPPTPWWAATRSARALHVRAAIVEMGSGRFPYRSIGRGPDTRERVVAGRRRRPGVGVAEGRIALGAAVRALGWLLGGTVGAATMAFAWSSGVSFGASSRALDRMLARVTV